MLTAPQFVSRATERGIAISLFLSDNQRISRIINAPLLRGFQLATRFFWFIQQNRVRPSQNSAWHMLTAPQFVSRATGRGIVTSLFLSENQRISRIRNASYLRGFQLATRFFGFIRKTSVRPLRNGTWFFLTAPSYITRVQHCKISNCGVESYIRYTRDRRCTALQPRFLGFRCETLTVRHENTMYNNILCIPSLRRSKMVHWAHFQTKLKKKMQSSGRVCPEMVFRVLLGCKKT